jgi:hypothetical protein
MLTRRRFLASSLAVPALVPYAKSNFTRAEKVRIAVIGVANRGAANLAGVAGEEIVALCDVDPKHAEKARKQFPNAKYFTDYRKMYDAVAKDIDAIVVSTPSAWRWASIVTAKSRSPARWAKCGRCGRQRRSTNS